MSIFIVLDILLIVMIGLFAPIGYWRGPVRELFVTLGVLFGILLADFWARPWGRDLADISDLTNSSGGFVMAFIFLVASTFILGYGIGATLGNLWHSPEAKVLGAAIAVLNGVLLLSFSLQYVRLFLLSDANEENLHDSFVADFLLDEIGWVLLGAAFLAIPLLLWILITGRRAYGYDDEYGYEQYDDFPIAAAARGEQVNDIRGRQQALPPRVPVARTPAGTREDEPVYKNEPPARRRSPQAASRPLIVSEPVATAEPVIPEESSSDRMSDTDPHIVLPISGRPTDETPTAQAQEGPSERADVGASEQDGEGLPSGFSRCVNCHAVLGPDTTICPNCGTLR